MREKGSIWGGTNLTAGTSLIGVDVDLYSGWIKSANLEYTTVKSAALDQITVPGSQCSEARECRQLLHRHSPRVAVYVNATLLPRRENIDRSQPLVASRGMQCQVFQNVVYVQNLGTVTAVKISEVGYEIFDPAKEYFRFGYSIQRSAADFEAGFRNLSRGLNIWRWAPGGGPRKCRTGPRNFCNRWHRIQALARWPGCTAKRGYLLNFCRCICAEILK